MLRRLNLVVTVLVTMSMLLTTLVSAQDFATPVGDTGPVEVATEEVEVHGDDGVPVEDATEEPEPDATSEVQEEAGDVEAVDAPSISAAGDFSPMAGGDDEVGWITIDPSLLPHGAWYMDMVIYPDGEWPIYLFFSSSSETETISVPAGTCTWSVDVGPSFQVLTGEIEVIAGESYTLPDGEFVAYPVLQFMVVDANNNPVRDISVTVRHTDGRYRGGTSNNAGMISVNVPYGEITYEFSAASKWVLPAGGSLVFGEDTATIPVQVSSVPTGTMVVNIEHDSARPLSGSIYLETIDGIRVDDAQLQSGQSTYFFNEVPFDQDYTLRVEEYSGWYEDYEAVHRFEEGVPINITLPVFAPIQVEIVASSTVDGVPLRSEVYASFTVVASNRQVTSVPLVPQADGSLHGTATVPKTALRVNGYTSVYETDLPLVFDPSSSSAPVYMLDLAFTPLPGWVTVNVTAPAGVVIPGNLRIERDGEWISNVWFGAQSGSFTNDGPLTPGDYTWSYDGGGIFAPQSGVFTIVDADIEFALDLTIAPNGVIVLSPQLAGDHPDDYSGGSVIVQRADGTVQQQLWFIDLRHPIAFDPVPFGTYTIDIIPNGLPWREVTGIPVTVDKLEVQVDAPIPNYDRIDLTFELYGDGGPVIGQVVLCQYDNGHGFQCGNENGGDSYVLDETGTVVIEGAWNRTSSYFSLPQTMTALVLAATGNQATRILYASTWVRSFIGSTSTL